MPPARPLVDDNQTTTTSIKDARPARNHHLRDFHLELSCVGPTALISAKNQSLKDLHAKPSPDLNVVVPASEDEDDMSVDGTQTHSGQEDVDMDMDMDVDSHDTSSTEERFVFDLGFASGDQSSRPVDHQPLKIDNPDLRGSVSPSPEREAASRTPEQKAFSKAPKHAIIISSLELDDLSPPPTPMMVDHEAPSLVFSEESRVAIEQEHGRGEEGIQGPYQTGTQPSDPLPPQPPPLSEFASSLYNSGLGEVPSRAYPLRQRTFQQQKPYTADKQHHARLIGRRDATVLPARRRTPPPSLFQDDYSNLQEDSEDSDYEEAHLLAQHDSSLNDNLFQESSRSRASSEQAPAWFMEELEEDILPTLEQMRRQGDATSHEIASRYRGQSLDLPLKVRMPPKLSAKSRKILEKMANQNLEPIDALDAEPRPLPKPRSLPKPRPANKFQSQQPQPRSSSVELSTSTDRTGIARKHSSVEASPKPLTKQKFRVRQHLSEEPTREEDYCTRQDSPPFDFDPQDPVEQVAVSELSSEESMEPIVVTKKAKKHRQHVLPNSFFKRNLIPEDAATLKSMRSKQRNHPRSTGALSQSDGEKDSEEEAQHAHHARTRISSGQAAGSLNDFMAKLAQDQSEDDESLYTTYQKTEERRRRTSWTDLVGAADSDSSLPSTSYRLTSRPNLRDTEPSTSYNRSTEDINDHSDRGTYSDTGYNYASDGPLPSRERSRSPKKSAPKRARGERLDMIDRMIVRSSRPSTQAASSSRKARSNKRRRISGNLQPSKFHRHYSAGEEQDDYDQGSFFSDDDFATHPGNAKPIQSRPREHQRLSTPSNTGSIPSDAEISDGSEARSSRASSRASSRGPSLYQSRLKPITLLERYDTTTPQVSRPPRPAVRAKVVSVKRPTAPQRRVPLFRKQTRPTTSRTTITTSSKNPKRPASRTLQSQLSTWHVPQQSIGPQFINKPIFIQALKPPNRTVATHTSIPPTTFSETTTVQGEGQSAYQHDEQPWDYQEYEDDTGPNASSSNPAGMDTAVTSTLPRSLRMPILSARSDNAETHPCLSVAPIPNGLYFTRDSYIGRGNLSCLLKAIDESYNVPKSLVGAPASADTPASEIMLFGQLYRIGWDIPVIERELQDVKETLERHLRQHVDESEPGVQQGQQDARAIPLALESLTTLIIERLRRESFDDRCSFWNVFQEAILSPMINLMANRFSPSSSAAILWGQWTLATWVILAECSLPTKSEVLPKLVENLMRSVVAKSSKLWLSSARDAEKKAQVSQGVIYGQDLLQLWVSAIKVLDRASLKTVCSTFWESFNEVALPQLRAGFTAEEQQPTSDNNSLETNGWHLLELVATLSRLHQFDRNGSSDPSLRPTANWKPIAQVLQQGWLETRPSGGTRESERRLREYLIFHHGLIQQWDGAPCGETVARLYRHFSANEFRDLSTEPGYRLPQFLQQMISSPANSVMTSVDKVDSQDRCFEIFLKIVARTIRYQVDTIMSANEAVAEKSQVFPDGSPNVNLEPNKTNLIKACKRMLSSISTAMVTTYPVFGASNQSYSTLCNACNLTLLVALLVPDYIRRTTVGQLRSLLDYDDSDDASRRIMLEAMYYLGSIWRREDNRVDGQGMTARSLANITDYFYGRIDFMREELEKELKVDNSTSYVSRFRRLNPTESLIETALGYVMRLLHDREQPRVTSFPCLYFLDRRLAPFLDSEKEYPPELRLQALGVLEYFFKLRIAYSKHLEEKPQEDAAQNPTSPVPAMIETAPPIVPTGDGFSSLDFEDMFDNLDDFDLSQLSETNSSDTRATTVTQPTPLPPPPPPPPNPLKDSPDEKILVGEIESWIYPTMSKFISSRHQAFHEDTQQQLKSTLPHDFHQAKIGDQSGALLFSAKNNTINSGNNNSNYNNNTKSQTGQQRSTAMSSDGVWRVIATFADCGMVLLDQGIKSLQELGEPFKSETWLSLWIQYARSQDELSWATRFLECNTEVFGTNEDFFLGIWFRTIGAPVVELTVQHRYMRAIMRYLNDKDRRVALISDSLLASSLFRDLPLAYVDDRAPAGPKETTDNIIVDQILMDSALERRLKQEFKESRLQILSKVLSNMGERYLELRSGDAVHLALAAKNRYQTFLGQLLRQIKQDYERLSSKKMVRDNRVHVELAHHVVGCVVQHCGLIVQNSPLTGSQESILGYLTSSRFFPQPRHDNVYIHQKIRGYAILSQTGDKQFFLELLELTLNQLRLVRGSNSFRFNLSSEYSVGSDFLPPIPSTVTAVTKASTSVASVLKIRVVDCNQTVYGQSEQTAEEIQSPAMTSNFRPGSLLTQNGPPSVGSKPTIQTLVANQGVRIKEQSEVSRDALWTLTSSLRNATLETDDRKQWNLVLSRFRTLLLSALFKPFLTAFLGDRPDEGHCPSFMRIGASNRRLGPNATSRWSATAGLMTVAIPATRWLQSLIEALSSDISQLPSTPSRRNTAATSTSGGSNSASDARVASSLTAFDTFQKETSIMFLPMLQSLGGCYDAVTRTRLLETARNQIATAAFTSAGRAGAAATAFEYQNQISDQERVAYQGLYLFSQLLQAIKSIVKVACKMKSQHPDFYEKNSSWREALLELVQVTFDHSLDMMITLGGSLEEDDNVVTGEEPEPDPALAEVLPEAIYGDFANRIPGVQNLSTLESRFGEFLSGHSFVSANSEAMVFRELMARLLNPQGWAGDIMSEVGLDSAMSGDSFEQGSRLQHHRPSLQQPHQARSPLPSQQQPRPSTPSARMRRLQWILWSLLSSHLDFSQEISYLDPRFNRQVQRSLHSVLLKPPQLPGGPLSMKYGGGSVWYNLIHSSGRGSKSQAADPVSSWGLLGRCLGKEWNLFLTSFTGRAFGCGTSSSGAQFGQDFYLLV
ncbi:hypothetical protein BGZ83_010449 [Gryganskiella cystojenkinii]|nr:hypothetical protein BGZ83_010449 [Gryganskiella cystojenkinii]